MQGFRRQSGFTLVELMVALTAMSFLSIAAVGIAQATSRSFQLQQNQSALQENARFALAAISNELKQAAFTPEPWTANAPDDPLSGSVDDATTRGDSLEIQRLSDHNCFDHPNLAKDGFGKAQHYLRITRFQVGASGQLSLQCRYGPDENGLVTQINNLGLVEYANALQVVLAEDSDNDGNADGWVRIGQQTPGARVMGVRLGLSLSSPSAAGVRDNPAQTLLGEEVTGLEPGHLHLALETTTTLNGSIRR